MDNILTIRTNQISPFRDMIKAIKDILTDVTITFTSDGIKITRMDNTHTILVAIYLYEEKFEFYKCNADKIIICVNIYNLFKIIEPITNDDTLTMYINKADCECNFVNYLSLRYENEEIGQSYTQKLRLIDPVIDPNQYELNTPYDRYSTIINLPSVDFQKIVRGLSGVSDKVEIKSVENKLIFSCTGSFASSEIIRSELDGSIQKFDVSKVILGEFSLKSLSNFIKCTPLCTNLEMYLENDLPLIVIYNVGDLGRIKLCLWPLPSV
jgi:proliferating cell nuclear antigen